MEWNQILMIMSGASAVAMLLRLTRSPARQMGWISVAMLVLVVLGLTYLIQPDYAGFIAGGTWALFVLVPSFILRRIQRDVTLMRFERAARLSRIVRWLHPMDGWWHSSKLYLAHDRIERGDHAGARALLEPLSRLTSATGINSRVLTFRLDRDWQGLINFVNSLPGKRPILRSGQILPLYLRALGELGRTDEMVDTYSNHQDTLDDDAFVMVRANARWMLFALSGHTAQMNDLLDSHFPSFSVHRRMYWTARAEAAAGNAERARDYFLRVSQCPERSTADAARHYVDFPPPPAQISPQSHQSIEQIAKDITHERRYAVIRTGPRSRPVITWMLMAINIAVFFVEVQQGGSQDAETLLKLGAAESYGLYPDQWWRVITANFLHFGSAHLIANLLGLFILGPFVEQFMGRRRYLAVYLVSGVGAIALTIWIQSTILHNKDILIGASGAIMGLAGATAGIMMMGVLRERAAVAGRRLRVLLLVIAIQAVMDQITPQVSGMAHLLGAAIGCVTALLILLTVPLTRVRRALST